MKNQAKGEVRRVECFGGILSIVLLLNCCHVFGPADLFKERVCVSVKRVTLPNCAFITAN